MKYSQNNFLPYDGEVYYFPNFFDSKKTKSYFKSIEKTSHFRQDKIKMFGKEMPQPRLVAWHGDKGITYTYSHIKMEASPWTRVLGEIKEEILKVHGINFNSVLVNYYRNGEDYMSYHTDNEKELGANPIIASVSLGKVRDFYFKHNETKEVVKFALADGDLLIMKGKTQEFWKHSIPKRKNISEPRINLTFRTIYSA